MKKALTSGHHPHVLPSAYEQLCLLLAASLLRHTVLGFQTPVLGPSKAEGGVPEGPDMGAPMLRRSSEL